jgi:hypothetical protein
MWTNWLRWPHINRPPSHFILSSSLLTICERQVLKFSPSLGLSSSSTYVTCLEGQIVDAFADFWMEFLQLGFYLMLSW